MSYVKDNEHWILSAKLYWKLRDDAPADIKCTGCNGHGELGGGPFQWEDPTECVKCTGRGKITNPELIERPDMPEDFHRHMSIALGKYINGSVDK